MTTKNQTTPEQVALLAFLERLSSIITADYLEERAKRAKLERLQQLLAKVPDVEPVPGDEL